MSATGDTHGQPLVLGLLTPCDDEQSGADDRTHLACRLRARHREMLWLSLVAVVGALLLRTGADGHVAPLGITQLTLPETCGSRQWFGVECPGCGLTRSFIALAQGDLIGSVAYNRVGWIVALAVLVQFPYRWWALRELRTRTVERIWMKWFGWALIAALIGNWVGNVTGLF